MLSYRQKHKSRKVGTTAGPCTTDYLQVDNNANFADETYKKCGTEVPDQPPVSQSNKLYVKLVVDQTNAAAAKFEAKVTEDRAAFCSANNFIMLVLLLTLCICKLLCVAVIFL
ncbi:unnamed protein product [Echinostoma caproni]|uniref:CUB domain-containing protein n=1 Tax=Echinostoma caproni TaxID=27848 RepID=A0A183B830_9TREM|nr:unnamed protein product [Echinostoma caproni]